LKPGIPALYEEEPKEKCPDCSQPLTFVRTRNHERRWYCYSCERYVDSFPDLPTSKDAIARLDALNGLQVIDSHGVILGRVRKAIPNEKGDIKALVMSVDKEQFRSILDDRELPREFELGHDHIGAVGDVVILSDVFSPKALGPPKPSPLESTGPKVCGQCGAAILAGARHCIRCGASLEQNHCSDCGTINPLEAKFCKNCGARMSGLQASSVRP
jgi:sporulation protein YlmC with PRC-barrel domain/ribosomal protein L40E